MRANPQSNPFQPVTAMGVPMKEFGPIQVIDWAAVQDPSRRAEFGITRPMADEPVDTSPEQFSIPVLDQETIDQYIADLTPNIREAISSYFERQSEISEFRRERDQMFRDGIENATRTVAAAAVFAEDSASQRAARAFGSVLRDEFGFPLPTGAQVDRAWNNFISPVIANSKVIVETAQRRGLTGLPTRFVRAIADRGGQLFSSSQRKEIEKEIVPEEPEIPAMSPDPGLMVAPTAAELRDLRSRLAKAGFTPENVDQGARLYQEFMRNVRTFETREARDLGQRTYFTSIPLGLEPFVQQETDKMGRPTGRFTLQSRYYDPMASTLMNLGRPGAYTEQEVRQRLESDPSLVDASRTLGNREGRYLTPDRIVEQNQILPTLGALGVGELASLKQHMFDHGYYGSNNTDDMGALHYRNINQATVDAFSTMVRFAQENGYTFEGWREKITAEGGWFGAAPVQKPAPLIRLTSKDDIRTVANRVAQQTIGYQLREDELEQFVASYQNMERSAGLRMAGGGAVEMPPDIGVAAQQMIQDTRTAEADAFAVGNTIDILRQIMTGGGR